MAAEIVNLRLARKRRDRELHATQAAENRQRHGETKSERNQHALAAEKARRDLAGHRREGPPPEGDETP